MEAISVAVRRRGIVEARHRVHAVAVRGGEVVASAGDAGLVAYLRSSAKPIQALPVVRAREDLAPAEIAVACASHDAEPRQLELVRSLLAKGEASEDDLQCGAQEGRPPERIHNNCSGKHAGFIALCRARGWPVEGYRLPSHPLQQELLAEVAAAAGLRAGEIPTAVDGCGVVTFAMTLERMATAFGRWPSLEGGDLVAAAMRDHPQVVGGEHALDTALMRAVPGWVAKRGAEGLLCAVAPDGTAIAAKSEDGNPRPLGPALGRFLTGLGTGVGEDLGRVDVVNSRGEVVGEVTAE